MGDIAPWARELTPWLGAALSLLIGLIWRRPSTIADAERLNAMLSARLDAMQTALDSMGADRALLIDHNNVLSDAMRAHQLAVPLWFEYRDLVRPGGVRDTLREAFSMDEMRSLAFDLGIDANAIGGATGNALADSIWAYCQRMGRLTDLARQVRKLRP